MKDSSLAYFIITTATRGLSELKCEHVPFLGDLVKFRLSLFQLYFLFCFCFLLILHPCTLLLPHFSASHPFLPSLLCRPGGASRTLSRAVSRRPAEDREIGMINNYNYWQTCQLLCGNGHL